MDDKLLTLAWYHRPLFVALVAIISTLVVTQVMRWFEHRRAQKERVETLKVAFRGETDSIRIMLSGALKYGFEAFERGDILHPTSSTYPRTIYYANAGSLGELRDPELVGVLVNLYSVLQRLEEMEKTEKFADSLRLMTVAYKSSILVNVLLSEKTKHLEVGKLDIQIPDKDRNELNFCNMVLDRLGITEEGST